MFDRERQLFNHVRELMSAESARPQRLNFIQRLAPFSALGHLTNATFVVIYLWNDQPQLLLIGWFLWIASISVSILVHAQRYRGRNFDRLSPRVLTRTTLYTAYTALPWSLASVYVPLGVPSEQQSFIYVILIGMATGGCLVMASLPRCAVAFVGTALAPLVIGQLLAFTVSSVSFAVCVTTYLLLVTGFSCAHTDVLSKQERAQQDMQDSLARLQEANQAIDRLARSDAITGLMNRRALQDAMQDVFAAAPPTGLVRPLYLIDLDHFKSINDARGHSVGDRYLSVIGERLRRVSPHASLVARLGGDEFAVVLSAPVEEGRVLEIGQALIDSLSQNVRIDGWEMKAGCSIGVAVAPLHSDDPAELMTYADDALLLVKESGRAGVKVFDLERRNLFVQRATDAALLMLDVARGGIQIAYQPQVSLHDGRLVGFEALARWRHPKRGPVPPPEFLQFAEDNGMILDVSAAILDQIRADICGWRARGLEFGRIAVNLHPAQLSHPIELDVQLEALRAICGAERITLEVTENCVMGRGMENIPALLRELSGRGHRISLDDFGTGFASLSHLTELPIDEAKIDRKFVSATPDGMPDMTIVRAIYDMARPRGIHVVAEGVETEAQRSSLAALPDIEAQGWLFGKPMPAVDVPAFIRGELARRVA